MSAWQKLARQPQGMSVWLQEGPLLTPQGRRYPVLMPAGHRLVITRLILHPDFANHGRRKSSDRLRLPVVRVRLPCAPGAKFFSEDASSIPKDVLNYRCLTIVTFDLYSCRPGRDGRLKNELVRKFADQTGWAVRY